MSTILIVEDEVGARLALASQLEVLGEVILARNANEANTVIKSISGEQLLNLAIVDLRLPGPSGIDPDAGFGVAERIQAVFPATPIIVVTIRNDRAAWGRVQRYASVRYFFTKPWCSSQLRDAAKKCLAGIAEGLTLVGKVEGINEDQAER